MRRRRTLCTPFAMLVNALCLALPLLGGCGNGDDGPRRVYIHPPPSKEDLLAPPPRLMRRGPPVIASDETPPTEIPDFLSSTPAPTPPGLAGEDALEKPATMPTDHSHWLRGVIAGGTVTVSVNGALLGDLSGPVDRDITWYCRRGINKVDFIYRAARSSGLSSASAMLQVVESEHDPPIPPLITYRRDNSRGDVGVANAAAALAAPDHEMSLFTAR